MTKPSRFMLIFETNLLCHLVHLRFVSAIILRWCLWLTKYVVVFSAITLLGLAGTGNGSNVKNSVVFFYLSLLPFSLWMAMSLSTIAVDRITGELVIQRFGRTIMRFDPQAPGYYFIAKQIDGYVEVIFSKNKSKSLGDLLSGKSISILILTRDFELLQKNVCATRWSPC
jgi:hypothetical protein